MQVRKESDASYRKYQLKNRPNEKIRPFYKWKDGFIDRYLNRGSLQPTDIPAVAIEPPRPSFLEGLHDQQQASPNNCEEVKLPSLSKPEESDDYTLRSNLFNRTDKISPVSRYYYNSFGTVSREGRTKKRSSI